MNRRLTSLKGLKGAATQMIAGGVLVLILALLRGERIVFPLTPGAILGEFQLIIMGGLVGFSVFVCLLARTTPSVATSYAFINPDIAAFLGWWLAGETVSLVNILAMIVILAGVALVFTGRPVES
jgi:drug/metabolite transporter (DMT)-like permease